MSEFKVVENRPELIRDTFSKGIVNRDVSAYESYMEGAQKRKQRRTQIDNSLEEINSIKQEMSEMKEMLRQLLEKIVDGHKNY